jgi:hypothetical protein
MADLQSASEEIKQISKDVADTAPSEEKPQGLLARPEEENTDGN